VIVEMRTYQVVLGRIGEFLRLYEAEGLPIQRPILGNLLGYYSTEIGTLSQLVHLWGYEDLNDRAKRRETLFNDPAWIAFVEKSTPFFVAQENKILIPAPFSPGGIS
jgi:hypothetical protein